MNKTKQQWMLRPSGRSKPMPSYVPEPITKDYEEACAILDLSPKASATLARRCLQGIIRDYHGIKKRRLKDEIDSLQEKVDRLTWQAIDAVRQLGNIGAHMEMDINVITDVEPSEAEALVRLIEILVEDWYVARHNREEHVKAAAAIAASKAAKKDPTESGAPEVT